MNFVIPVNAKHPAEAAQFGLWITSSYWQVEFGKHATILPSTKISFNSDPWFMANSDSDLAIKAQVMAGEASGYCVDFSRIEGLNPEKQAEFTRVLNDLFIAAIKGEYTAEEALSKAEKECNEVLSK